MEPITSTRNEKILLCHSLHRRKGREETGLFLVEGLRLCEECLKRAPETVEFLLYGERLADHPILLNAKEKGIPMFPVSEAAQKKASDSQQSQGILLVAHMPHRADRQSQLGGDVLALSGIADPGNMGAILRSAWAFGIRDVLMDDGCVDAYNPKVVRSGMGAHFSIQLHQVENLLVALQGLQKQAYTIIGGDMDGTPGGSSTQEKRCIVIGGEAEGLSPEIKLCCDRLYSIPMVGGADSLNAAVAAGILMDRLLNRSDG